MKFIPRENFRSGAALARFFLVMILALSLDLWSKSFAFEELKVLVNGQGRVIGSDYHKIIPGWLQFEGQTNHGAVFGMGEGQRALFLTVSVAAILFLTYLFATSGRQRFYQVILGLLLAGVLGNMYDRIRFGYVRDMIHAFPGQTWPGTDTEVFPWIFNVADILLCLGVGLMMAYSLLMPIWHRPDAEPASGASAGRV